MDSLLEHYMPSLMALKKALPGRQPEVLESHLFLLCAFIKFRNKNNAPRFAFRMFTLLDGLYGAGQNFGCSARFYIFLLERQMVLILFALYLYTNRLFFLTFLIIFHMS